MVKKKKQNFFARNYEQSFNYIQKSKNFIYTTIIIFCFFILAAIIFPVPEQISQAILEIIKDLLGKTETLSQGEIIKFIFFILRTIFYIFIKPRELTREP